MTRGIDTAFTHGSKSASSRITGIRFLPDCLQASSAMRRHFSGLSSPGLTTA